MMKSRIDIPADFITSLHIQRRIRKKHGDGIRSERIFTVSVMQTRPRNSVHGTDTHHVVGSLITAFAILFHPHPVAGMSVRAKKHLIRDQVHFPQMPQQPVIRSDSDISGKTVAHPRRICILRQITVIRIRINRNRRGELFQIIPAVGLFCKIARPSQCGQEHGRQNRDNCNNHKQFYQCKIPHIRPFLCFHRVIPCRLS